jgi:hypothetical protein
MAGDRALGLIDRAQLLAGTERANLRLAEIGTELDGAALENADPGWWPQKTQPRWETLDLTRPGSRSGR